MDEENKIVTADSEPAAAAEEAAPDDYMKKIYENSVKELGLRKISSFCTAGIFAVILITTLILVPKTVKLLDQANDIASNAQTTIDNADDAIADISDMANELSQAGSKMNQMLEDNEERLVESIDKISNIDFDGLNEGIKDLQEAVGPFANLMGRFR